GPNQRPNEESRPQRKEPNRIRHVPLPHVGERPRAAAERTRMPGQVKERTRRKHEVAGPESEEELRVHQPRQQPKKQSKVARAVRRHGAGYRNRNDTTTIASHQLSSPTIWAVVSATASPPRRH